MLKITADEDGMATLKKCLLELKYFGNCLNLLIDINKGITSELGPFIPLCCSVCTNLIQKELQSLTLGSNVWDKESRMSQLVEDILHHFSSNLEYLEVKFYFGNHDAVLELRRDDSLTFPKAKGFGVKFCY